jgi:hypothetical protein
MGIGEWLAGLETAKITDDSTLTGRSQFLSEENGCWVTGRSVVILLSGIRDRAALCWVLARVSLAVGRWPGVDKPTPSRTTAAPGRR